MLLSPHGGVGTQSFQVDALSAGRQFIQLVEWHWLFCVGIVRGADWLWKLKLSHRDCRWRRNGYSLPVGQEDSTVSGKAVVWGKPGCFPWRFNGYAVAASSICSDGIGCHAPLHPDYAIVVSADGRELEVSPFLWL